MLANKNNPTPDNPDNLIYILNLSTIHTLTSSRLQTQPVTLATADHSDRIPLPGQAQSFFAEAPDDNLISSETTPLFLKPKP